jgi:hypothetical protein
MGHQNVILTILLGNDIFYPHGFGLLVSRGGNPCQLCHFLLKVFLRRDSWTDIRVSSIVMCQFHDCLGHCILFMRQRSIENGCDSNVNPGYGCIHLGKLMADPVNLDGMKQMLKTA